MHPKEFWKKQEVYPDYGTIPQRRLYELNYLVPRLNNVNSILDLGCGDGSLIKCLKELTNIKEYYAYDVSENLLLLAPDFAVKKIYDIYSLESLPRTDVTLLGGVLPCIYEDEIILNLFNLINSSILYIRTPCSLDEKQNIDTYSEKLKSQYAATYRTVREILSLLEKKFKVSEINRIYPDEIESEFGTKQFYFKCIKKNGKTI